MTRALAMAVVALGAGCGFDPSGLAPGGDGAVVDGEPTDGRDPIDAPSDGRDPIDASIDAAIDAPPFTCPGGYQVLGTGIYRHETTARTWLEAYADCNDDDMSSGGGGHTHLVVLSGEVERTGVRSIFPGPKLWIGLSDRVTTSTWLWVTLEPTGTYPPGSGTPPWKSGQPNHGGGGAEHCVQMDAAGLFDDQQCDSDTEEYICECDGFAAVDSQSSP